MTKIFLKTKEGLHWPYCFHGVERGWSGISNGKLLQLMIDDRIQALLTFDKNLQYQQNFRKYTISLLVLNAVDNRYETLRRLVPKILEHVSQPLIEGPLLISE